MQIETTPVNRPPKLLGQVRDRLRVKHYSLQTEKIYIQWIKRFILFHGKRHPKELGAKEVELFLTQLAVIGQVSASTQNQALSALLFLYKEVLSIDLPWLDNVVRAKRPQRLPVVLSRKYPNAGAEWAWQYIFPSGSHGYCECPQLAGPGSLISEDKGSVAVRKDAFPLGHQEKELGYVQSASTG